jgi:hypothetical protein
MEALLVELGKYYLVCQSGNRYELTEEEFDLIKNSFKQKLENAE